MNTTSNGGNQANQMGQRTDDPFRLLVESVIDYAIFMLDPEGHVQTWNLGAQRIKGYSQDEIIGQHFRCFYPPEANAAGWPEYELQEARANGRFEDEGWRLRKDGSRFWANVIITALYDEHRELRGFVKVTRDLSERRRVEALEASKRRMTEFMAMLAHELRNPLAPLRNATEILRSRPEDVQAVQWSCEVLGRQVTLLTRLVDDLLDVSRVTSGKISLEKVPLDLNTVAQSAVESVRSSADAREQQLSWEKAPEALTVLGDGVRLCQVVINLLNNAIKYTPEGGSISCVLQREEKEAVLRVRDNGMGIPPTLLPYMFDLFTQGERSLHRAEGGLGIGLTLVQRLVRMHGGRVEADSAGYDRGAEFTVRLPLCEAPQMERATAATVPETRLAASRILVVDSHRDAAETLANLLRIWGSEVRICYDGEAAFNLAESFLPHVILFEIALPRLDGHSLARRVRALPALADTVLIAISGAEVDAESIREAGFSHHFVKPVEMATLVETLAALRPQASEKEKDSAATPAPMAAPPSTSLG